MRRRLKNQLQLMLNDWEGNAIFACAATVAGIVYSLF